MKIHTRQHWLLLAAICAAGSAGMAAGTALPITAAPKASLPNAIVFEAYGMLKISGLHGLHKKDLAASEYVVEQHGVSPNGRRVVYDGGEQSDRLTVLDLWTQRKWISRGHGESSVSWAPDSARLAYIGAKGDLRVWSLKDGTDKLVSMSPSFPYDAPAWSPTGDLIAVTRHPPGIDEFGELRFVSVKTQRLLGVKPRGQWSKVSWAPHGTSLAGVFKASAKSTPFAAVVSVKTGRVAILRGTDRADEVAWAPRGPWIAISRFLRKTGPGGGDWEGELLLANPRTGALRSLRIGQFTGLQWYPTAQKLLYTGWVGGHRPETWEVDVQTKAARRRVEWGSGGQYARVPVSGLGSASGKRTGTAPKG